jgi:hypothetical protein
VTPLRALLTEEAAHLVVAQRLGYPAVVTEDYTEVNVFGDPSDFDCAVIASAGAMLRADITGPASPIDQAHLLRLHPDERQAAVDRAVALLIECRADVLLLVGHWMDDLNAPPV